MNEKIRDLRKTLGLTLEKFGERLGVKKAVLSQIENGKANLTDQMFTAICNVNWDGKYVNAEWLRTGNGEMFKKDTGDELKALAEKYKMSDMEYAFLREYFKLPQNQRESFFEALDIMFSNIHANTNPTLPETSATSEPLKNSSEELSDEEIVRRYRKMQELERQVKEKSEAS